MIDLQSIYNSHELPDKCKECTISKSTSRPFLACMDQQDLTQADVLFLSDSYRFDHIERMAFSEDEIDLITSILENLGKFTWAVSPSVKCPGVKEVDMSPNNMNICRDYLEETVKAVNPKLIFVCGNLAMKMLVKKSGISNKRGKQYSYEDYPVIPIFHPLSVIIEPRHKFLFEADIKNAINKYIFKNTVKTQFEYKVLTKIPELQEELDILINTDKTISCDIETTGLNFLRDTIMTVAFSEGSQSWVVPIDHKEVKWSQEEREIVLSLIRRVLMNPKNKKVFHNAKFDMKFLKRYGVGVCNVWDTKLMHHLIDENAPKSLMDLVKIYFPEELEKF
jgi:uracil-DNA glycosylase family 4